MTATPFPTTGYRLNRSCDRDHENLFVLITLLNYYARQKINFLPILTHIVNVSTNVIHPFFYLLKKKKTKQTSTSIRGYRVYKNRGTKSIFFHRSNHLRNRIRSHYWIIISKGGKKKGQYHRFNT